MLFPDTYYPIASVRLLGSCSDRLSQACVFLSPGTQALCDVTISKPKGGKNPEKRQGPVEPGTTLYTAAIRSIGSMDTAVTALTITAENAIVRAARLFSQAQEDNAYFYFELAYTRQTEWMCWLVDKSRKAAPGEPASEQGFLVLAYGQSRDPALACYAVLRQLETMGYE